MMIFTPYTSTRVRENDSFCHDPSRLCVYNAKRERQEKTVLTHVPTFANLEEIIQHMRVYENL